MPGAHPAPAFKGVVGVDAAGDVLYLVDNTGRDKSALLAVELATGRETVLATDADADIRPIAVVDRVTGRVLAATAQFDQLRRYVIDECGAERLCPARKTFRRTGGHAGDQRPGSRMAGRSARRRTRAISRVPAVSSKPSSRSFRLTARSIDFRWPSGSAHVATTRDGLRLPCHLYLPPGADANGDGLPDCAAADAVVRPRWSRRGLPVGQLD